MQAGPKKESASESTPAAQEHAQQLVPRLSSAGYAVAIPAHECPRRAARSARPRVRNCVPNLQRSAKQRRSPCVEERDALCPRPEKPHRRCLQAGSPGEGPKSGARDPGGSAPAPERESISQHGPGGAEVVASHRNGEMSSSTPPTRTLRASSTSRRASAGELITAKAMSPSRARPLPRLLLDTQ